jgi:hypothetical protein
VVLRFLLELQDLPYYTGLLATMPRETRVDNTANRSVPVTLPIGDCPESIYFEPVFRRGGPACGHELMDESPVRHLYPVAVENIAHGRALEPMPAEPFQGGVAWLTSTLPQLIKVIDKTLCDAVLTTFHELSLAAPRKRV